MTRFKKPHTKIKDLLRGKQSGFALPLAILIAVVLIVVGGAGYYFYKTSQQEQEEVEVPKPEQVLNETADWKVYKNEEYGYEFKYPLYCFYGPMPPYCKGEPPERRPSECLCFLTGENPDEVFLQAYTGEKDRLVLATFSVSHYMTQYFNPPFGTDLVSWLKEKFSNLYEDIPDKPNTEIDRAPAVKFYTPRSPQTFSGETIYFIKNGKLFVISMLDVDSESNKKLYKQILSTFKFIEEKDKIVQISVFVNMESFDLVNKTFEGWIRQEGEKTKVKVITHDSAKFYRTSEPSWEKEYFTFSELYSNTSPTWPLTVKGIFEKEGVIRANEVFIIIQ